MEEKWEENIKMFSVLFKEDKIKDISEIVEILDFWQKLALLYNKMPMLESHEKIQRVEENAKVWHNESHLKILFARMELVDEHAQNVLRLYAEFLAQRLQNSLFEGTGALYRLKKFLCPKQMEKFVSFGQLTQKYPQLKEILRRRLNTVEIMQLQMVNYISLFDFDTDAPQWKQSQFLLDNLAYYIWFKEHSKNLTESEQKHMEENYAKMEICEKKLFFGDYGDSSTDGQKSILKSVFSMHEQSLKPLLLVNNFRQKLKGIYIDTERIGGELHEKSAVFSIIKELCLGVLYSDEEKNMYKLLKKYFLLLIRTSDEPISEEEKQKFNIETYKANNEIVVANLLKFVSNLNAENERQLIWIVSEAATELANLGLIHTKRDKSEEELGEESIGEKLRKICYFESFSFWLANNGTMLKTTLNADEQIELYKLIFDSDEKTSREAETKLAMKQLPLVTTEYLEKIFGNFHFGARLLVWDSFRCHISEDTKKTLRRLALHSAVIPGGTTKYIQAPDVCWNAPFKEAIRKVYNDWMAHGEKATTSGGNLKAPPMEVYLEWIANTWDSLPKQMIADSFLTCGITKEEKGRHDDKIHVFKPDGAIPNGLALLKQHRQEEEVLKMVEEIDLGEDESDEEIDVEVS
ncbi:hypothetical protein niasHT_027291 [Heterodera trifolii]|uniref:DDE-1 domain-containing protein n=1 Tax=Heterodera trifolii TaxID=157864 RepID=A0ABD2JTQ0_9BILA